MTTTIRPNAKGEACCFLRMRAAKGGAMDYNWFRCRYSAALATLKYPGDYGGIRDIWDAIAFGLCVDLPTTRAPWQRM